MDHSRVAPASRAYYLILHPRHRQAPDLHPQPYLQLYNEFNSDHMHSMYFSVALQVPSVGTTPWNRYSMRADISFMFGTGAAKHVCTWWFGEHFPTFEWTKGAFNHRRSSWQFNSSTWRQDHSLQQCCQTRTRQSASLHCV